MLPVVKVTILTEGGRGIGLGHITRCLSLYQAFEDYGVQAEILINGDESVMGLLGNIKHERFNWLVQNGDLFEKIKGADIVIIDSYLAGLDLYVKISNMVNILACFDDDLRLDYPRGIIINGAVLAEQMPYPKRENVKYLLGTQYTPLRKEFWDVPPKHIRKKVETIMVTFGGSDIRNLTSRVLEMLIAAYPEIVKKIIITNGFQNTDEIKRLRDGNTELIYCPDSAGMKQVMLESDIAITAGGQTLYELARAGVPAITVRVAENQLINVCNWEGIGFIENAGLWSDKGLTEAIRCKLDLLKCAGGREHRSVIGNEIVDGAGSTRIVKKLLCEFHKQQIALRKATLKDDENIYNLANDDIVRANSFASDKISWEDHLKWFQGKLEDGRCFFFVVEIQHKFGGQVRFDITSENIVAEIGISLDESLRGLGLSSFIISESLNKLQKIQKNVQFVRARVKEDNVASIIAFERAGFRFSEKTVVRGCKAKVYERVVNSEL